MKCGNLDELRQLCSECSLCELHRGRTKVVFGAGNPHAQIMFIGEGPGEQEDIAGEPFEMCIRDSCLYGPYIPWSPFGVKPSSGTIPKEISPFTISSSPPSTSRFLSVDVYKRQP